MEGTVRRFSQWVGKADVCIGGVHEEPLPLGLLNLTCFGLMVTDEISAVCGFCCCIPKQPQRNVLLLISTKKSPPKPQLCLYHGISVCLCQCVISVNTAQAGLWQSLQHRAACWCSWWMLLWKGRSVSVVWNEQIRLLWLMWNSCSGWDVTLSPVCVSQQREGICSRLSWLSHLCSSYKDLFSRPELFQEV